MAAKKLNLAKVVQQDFNADKYAIAKGRAQTGFKGEVLPLEANMISEFKERRLDDETYYPRSNFDDNLYKIAVYFVKLFMGRRI